MKNFIFSLITIVTPLFSQAQLTIQNGAVINTIGNAVITLDNISLNNSGVFMMQSDGKLLMKGNNNQSIEGSSGGSIILDSLEIDFNGGYLLMEKKLLVNNVVALTNGFIDLDGHELALGSNAYIFGENNDNYITDQIGGGGSILITKYLDNPIADNVGELGASISSNQNLGSTEVRRFHSPVITSDGVVSNVVNRQYVISPANNTNLNATLQLHYLNHEINGLNENNLILVKCEDPYTTFTNEGATSVDTSNNLIVKTGINSFSSWAITDNNSPLPLLLLSFDLNCDGDKTELKWNTINEDNVAFFEIETGDDGKTWVKENTIFFNENNHNYTYISNHLNKFYRLKIVDDNGSIQYSNILKSDCNHTQDTIVVYPNPAHNTLNLILHSLKNDSTASIQFFDSKGLFIHSESHVLQKGINNLNFNIAQLLPGIYFLNIYLDNGNNQKQVKFVKE